MYAKSTRLSAKREVQKDRSAKRDDQIARPRRVMRMCPRSGQIFIHIFGHLGLKTTNIPAKYGDITISQYPVLKF